MKIKIDDFLTAEQIEDATKDNPVLAVIKEVNLIQANELPFDSDRDRYELTIELTDDGEETKWLANKTSLRSFKEGFGDETENWIDKEIQLWTIEQPVQGKEKKVVYGKAA